MKLRAHKEAADKARAEKLLQDTKAGPYVSPETAQYIGLHDKLKDQIAELDAQLAQLEGESSNYVDDLLAKKNEKGGDVEFLKLSVPAGQENAHRQQIIVKPTISQIKAAEHLQKEERRQVRDTGTKDYSSIHDADVFSTTRNCKPVETSHGVSSAAEQAFMYCWSSLPQDEDGFVMLDLDMIHDLFEYCGLFLTDHEATLCLNQSPVNQLGRRHHKDILKWYRHYVSAATRAMPIDNLPLYRVPIWRRIARSTRSFYEWVLHSTRQIIQGVVTQKGIVDMLGEIREKVNLILHPPELESEHDSQSGSLLSDFFGAEGSGGVAKAAGKSNILGELQGNLRLAAWHRQQLFTPNPTAIEFAASFDPRIAPLWSPYDDPNKKPATRSSSPTKGSRGGSKGQSRGGSPSKAGSAAGGRTGTSEARKSPSQRAKEKLEQQQNEENAMMRGTISLDCFVFAKDLVLGNRDDDRTGAFQGGQGTKAANLGSSAVKRTVAEELQASLGVDPNPPPSDGAAKPVGYLPPKEKINLHNNNKFSVDMDNRILYGVMSMTPGQVLPHFQKLHYKALGEKHISDLSGMVQDELFGSVVYLAVNVDENASFEQAQCLLVTLVNMFESIPMDDRKELYTKVIADVYILPDETKKEEKKNLFFKTPPTTPGKKTPSRGDTANNTAPPSGATSRATTPGKGLSKGLEWMEEEPEPPPPPRRVVLLGLLHEKDWFKELEDALPAGLLVTRALRDFSIKLMLNSTLKELYEASLPFEFFEQRMYGPQEDEIGEEGMNPLRFAKTVRQKQTVINTDLKMARDLGYSKLKDMLRARGMSDAGDRTACQTRFTKLRERDLEAVTSGNDLSFFGKEMVGKVFSAVKNMAPKIVNFIKSQDPTDPNVVMKAALSKKKPDEQVETTDVDLIHVENAEAFLLWDINRLLTGTEAWGTLFDGAEYRKFLVDMELLMDRKGLLTRQALYAFYEICGRLTDDVRGLGIGSLNEHMIGKVKASISYESECIASLLPLLETPTLAQQVWKQVLLSLCSLFEISGDAELQTFEQVFDLFLHLSKTAGIPWLAKYEREIRGGLKEPGMLARKIHEFSAWLADGRDGLIRSLRKTALADHGRFDQYHHVFRNFFENEILHFHDHDENNKNSGKGGNKADFVSLNITTGMGTTMPGVDEQSSVSGSLASFEANLAAVGLTRPDATPPKQESLPPPPEMNDDEIYELRGKLREMLLPIEDTHGVLKDIRALVEKADRLDRILAGKAEDGYTLTFEERNKIKAKKQEFEREAADLSAQMDRARRNFAPQALAAYDAMCLYGAGIACVGMGTREFCLKTTFKGMDFAWFLPPGLGELAPVKRAAEEKKQRAMQRKFAASAALEREKMRRDTSEAEREEMRIQERELMQITFDEEEGNIFKMSMEELKGRRAVGVVGNAPKVEPLEVIAHFQALFKTVAGRYPTSTKTALCASNYAAVIAELVGFDHFKADDGLQSLEQAVQILLDRMDEGGVLQPVLNEEGEEEVVLSASEALRVQKENDESQKEKEGGNSVKSTNGIPSNQDSSAGTVGVPLHPLPPVEAPPVEEDIFNAFAGRVLRHKRPSWIPLPGTEQPTSRPGTSDPKSIMKDGSRPASQGQGLGSRPGSRPGVTMGASQKSGGSRGTLKPLGVDDGSLDGSLTSHHSNPDGTPSKAFPDGTDIDTINQLFPDYLKGTTILILQNYLTFLREYTGKLPETPKVNRLMKIIVELLDSLPSRIREQVEIGQAHPIVGITILPVADFEQELQATVFFEQRKEEERLRLIEEARIAEEMHDELAALELEEGIRQAQIEQEMHDARIAEQKAHELFLASMTEKELKRYNTKMKKLAREKERQRQDDERKEITAQRKLYFQMIQNNDIDRVFDLKAEKGRPVTEVIHGSPLRNKPPQPPPPADNDGDAAASVISDGASVHSSVLAGEGQGQGHGSEIGENMMSVMTDGNGGMDAMGNDMMNSSSQLRAYGLGIDTLGIEEKDEDEEVEVVEDQEEGGDAVDISEDPTVEPIDEEDRVLQQQDANKFKSLRPGTAKMKKKKRRKNSTLSDASSVDPLNDNDSKLGDESAPGQGLAPASTGTDTGISTAATDPPTSGGIKGLFSWIFRKRANQVEATTTPSPSTGGTTTAAHAHTNNMHPSTTTNAPIPNPIITALEQSENHDIHKNNNEDNDDPIDALPLPEMVQGHSQKKSNPLSLPEKEK